MTGRFDYIEPILGPFWHVFRLQNSEKIAAIEYCLSAIIEIDAIAGAASRHRLCAVSSGAEHELTGAMLELGPENAASHDYHLSDKTFFRGNSLAGAFGDFIVRAANGGYTFVSFF